MTIIIINVSVKVYFWNNTIYSYYFFFCVLIPLREVRIYYKVRIVRCHCSWS